MYEQRPHVGTCCSFGLPPSSCLQVIVAQGGDKFYKHKGIAADGGVHMVIECVGGACFEVQALIRTASPHV